MELRYQLPASPRAGFLKTLVEQANERLRNPRHGDFSRWKKALDRLPHPDLLREPEHQPLKLGKPVEDKGRLGQLLQELHPWRKGPLYLGGVEIDTEWRSDWKWQRLAPHLGSIDREIVLDVGCGNGYFGWRMLAAGADLVVGIDPTLLFVMQHFACRHFAGGPDDNMVLPLAIEDLPVDLTGFDTVFSMGVLYHRRSPFEHLARLRQLIRPGGRLVLETLVIEGDTSQVLVPRGRYARMRNVWFLPSSKALTVWLERAGFQSPRCVDETVTTSDEQRSTDWMRFESLPEALDPQNPALTIEGLPAPRRAIFIASTPI